MILPVERPSRGTPASINSYRGAVNRKEMGVIYQRDSIFKLQFLT